MDGGMWEGRDGETDAWGGGETPLLQREATRLCCNLLQSRDTHFPKMVDVYHKAFPLFGPDPGL